MVTGSVFGFLTYPDIFTTPIPAEDTEGIGRVSHVVQLDSDPFFFPLCIVPNKEIPKCEGEVNFAGAVHVLENRLTVVQIVGACYRPTVDFLWN